MAIAVPRLFSAIFMTDWHKKLGFLAEKDPGKVFFKHNVVEV